ncbi:reverse transcriptase domain-containing protein [Tanacetum coccineum]
MSPIIEYLFSGILPADKQLARRIRIKAPNYQIIDIALYKRSFLSRWLNCAGPKQARKIMREIHEDELPQVLWAHRTSPKGSSKETPFSLAYGTEAMPPVEVDTPTKKANEINLSQTEDDLRASLEEQEEKKEIVTIRKATYKKKLEKYHEKKVKPMTFQLEEYILRLNKPEGAKYGAKIQAKWEGP